MPLTTTKIFLQNNLAKYVAKMQDERILRTFLTFLVISSLNILIKCMLIKVCDVVFFSIRFLFHFDKVHKEKHPKTYNFNILVKDPNMKVRFPHAKVLLLLLLLLLLKLAILT